MVIIFKEANDENQKELTRLREKIEVLEKERGGFTKELEIVKEEVMLQKLKIAKVLNVAFESGGSELVELIEIAILE